MYWFSIGAGATYLPLLVLNISLVRPVILSPQPPQRSFVFSQVFLVLSLELIAEVTNHPVIEIFTSQMSVSSSRFDLENTIFDGQDRHIKGTTTKIEDAHVLLSLSVSLLVQTVGDGGSGGFVDDSENVKSSDDSSIFGGLTLGIVEV